MSQKNTDTRSPTTTDSSGNLPPTPSASATPENRVAQGDPGDDTTQRFRYQWGLGAIHLISLVKGDANLEYVYCEHHEDVLLKYKDGKFCGIQIKTRAEGYDPFRATEEPIIESLKKFLSLEISFRGQFARFVLATNCGFWKAQKNKYNLGHLLSLVREAFDEGVLLDSKAELRDLLAQMRLVPKCTDVDLMAMLLKLHLPLELPHLPDMDGRVIEHLVSLDGLGEVSYPALTDLANRLTDFVSRASSHACEPCYRDYIAIMSNSDAADIRAIIDGKRITPDKVLGIISEFRLYHPDGPTPLGAAQTVSMLPSGLNRIQKKMAAGYINPPSIDYVLVQRDVAENYGLQTIYRWGNTRAEKCWNHICDVVYTDCIEAMEETETASQPFGKTMLRSVKERLRQRYERDKDDLYGYTYEHLIGIAAKLTDDCKVWWSEQFAIEVE